MIRALIVFGLIVSGVEFTARVELHDEAQKIRGHVISDAGNGGWTTSSNVSKSIRVVGFGAAFAVALLTYVLALHSSHRHRIKQAAQRQEQHLRAAQQIARVGSW